MDMFTLAPPPDLAEDKILLDNGPTQGHLFVAYYDVKPRKAARYKEPTLMDWLNDNPRKAEDASPDGKEDSP